MVDIAERSVGSGLGEGERRRGIPGPTAEQLGAVGFRCEICHLPFRKRHRLHWDHRIPRSSGGGDSGNLRLVHAVCNIRRGAGRHEGGFQMVLMNVPVIFQKKMEQLGAGLVTLIPGQPCPTCGKRVGLSSAERQRAWRARKRDD